MTAVLPNTIPGVAFLQSPLIVAFHLDELKGLVETQRQEIALVKTSVTKEVAP